MKIFTALVVLILLFQGMSSAHAQTVLGTPSVFAAVEGLNTVPDHGDTSVSFLDYRNGSYRIMVVDVDTGAEIEIASFLYAEPEVATFGKRAAWIGYSPTGIPDVYVHDRNAATTDQVTMDAAFQNHPDLAERYLVWQDYADAGGDGSGADIIALDFNDGSRIRITDDDSYQDLPRIHRHRVVWQDFRHAPGSLETSEIYSFDLETRSEKRLTSGSAYRSHPAIWSDLVVWEDYRSGGNADIFMYDLSTGLETRLTDDAAQQSHPAVYGKWVLWLDYRNSDVQGDLYGFNLETNEEYPLVVHPAHQEAPEVYDDHVVWQDYRNGSFDILEALLLDPADTSNERITERASISGSAAPNPSTGPVTLYLGESGGQTDRVDVIDILGRTVWSMRPPPGARSIRWDGVDLTGRAVGPGVYIAVVRRSNRTEHIVLVRN